MSAIPEVEAPSDLRCLQDAVVNEAIPHHARQLLLFHMMQMILYSDRAVIGDVLKEKYKAPIALSKVHWNDGAFASLWQRYLLLGWLEDALPSLEQPNCGSDIPYDLWDVVMNALSTDISNDSNNAWSVLNVIKSMEDAQGLHGTISLRYFKLFRLVAQNTAMPEQARKMAKKLMEKLINAQHKSVLDYIAQIAIESVGVRP